MRGKLFFGAATAALMMFAPGALAHSADQPGDNSTTAMFTGAAVNGEISPAGDVDRFRMRVEAGQRYSFTLDGIPNAEGVTLDPVLYLYDLEGNQITGNDDANGTLNSALTWNSQTSGEIFVEARSFSEDGTGAYTLAATSVAIPPDAVGNDAATRARVNVGAPVTGDLEYEGDADWYRLNVRSGQRYRIALNGAEGAANPLGDPYLRVVDRDGNELAANDDGNESLNSMLEFVPTSSTPVFVVASGYADAYTGTYTLTVNDERLPTDNYSSNRNTRGRINVGQTVGGTLDFAADTDWYRVRLEEGQSYRFTLRGSGGNAVGDPLLRLYNAQGEEVAMDDDGGGALNAYLEYAAPSTGTYFVEARGFTEEATGGYTLSALSGDIPADNTTDAVLTGEGDYRQGVLTAGDRDWYRINLGEGQGMRVSLNSAEGMGDALGDPYIVIYDANGSEVARDDDGGDGLNSWMEFQAGAAGAYYIEARGFSDDAAGRYLLTVVPGEIPAGADNGEYIQPNMDGRLASIGTIGDVDWFTLEMIEGRPYRINVMGGDGADGTMTDPLVTLYDSEGNVVASDDDGGWGLNSYLNYTSVTGGSYFVAVSSFGDAGTGRYWVQVFDTDVPGHVNTDENFDVTSGSDDRASRIDMTGDLDYYRVELEGGVRYTITVNGAGDDALGDAYVAIMDQSNTRVAADDDSGPGLDARLNFTPESSGTYFIQASGLGGTTGLYQVSIVRQ